ncbi:nuclease-related domain-containing protein [Paraglaciecola sp. 2405UD69-4]|uniref:nuclease-related domain-containing protein n=1 Tax=Paraglaciecola sp. 2405UD69-4 TaxID=3391836 RepID=UPI0039C9344E
MPASVLLPMLIFVGAIKLVLVFVGRKSRLPFDIKVSRRIAGQSVLSDFNDKSADLFGHLIMLTFLFNLPFIYIGAYKLLGIEKVLPWLLVPFYAAGIIYILVKTIRTTKSRNNLRLGLEAEWAVSSELHDIEAANYKVFHDIQCDKFNIDHLVVGPNGIFAIETKGRRKPNNSKTAKEKSQEHIVNVKGKILEFPNFTDTSIIEQATRQAKWAGTWLSEATGEQILVCPVVTIPGWFIKIISKPIVPVIATKILSKQIPKLYGQPLSLEQIKRVAHQVKQKTLRINDLI